MGPTRCSSRLKAKREKEDENTVTSVDHRDTKRSKIGVSIPSHRRRKKGSLEPLLQMPPDVVCEVCPVSLQVPASACLLLLSLDCFISTSVRVAQASSVVQGAACLLHVEVICACLEGFQRGHRAALLPIRPERASVCRSHFLQEVLCTLLLSRSLKLL